MGKKDPRLDAYIAKSAGFAKPVLTYLREVVHEGCPDVVEELKWSAPHFRVLEIPDSFMKAVRKNTKALKVFEGASYSFRKEYVAWVVDAKSHETRERRLTTAVEWISEGKGRNWKYER